MNEMSKAAKAAQKEYLKQWRAKNKAKISEYNKKYREANPDKFRQYVIDYWERKANESSIEQKVVNLHEQGLSLREIARKVGLSHMKVSRILKSVTEL